MNAHEEVTVYQPDNSIRRGYFSIFPDIVREIVDNRWLTLQIFRRDFTAAYKQSMMGIVWAFIIPLFSVGTFVMLNRSGIFNIGELSVPYAIYVVLGMALWQLFSTGLLASSQSLVLAGQMINKINFSRKSLVIASVGQAFVAFLIQLVLFIVLCVYYGVTPHSAIFWLPVIIVPLLLFTLGLGFILSLVNGVMRDVSSILPMFLTFLMFLTPVLYPKPHHGVLAEFARYNPMYCFITAARDLAFQGRLSDPVGLAVVSGIVTLVFVICLTVFHLTETRITERV